MVRWKFHRDYQVSTDSMVLYIARIEEGNGRRKVAVMQPPTLVESVGGGFNAPTFDSDSDERAFLQAALECAWGAGLRPDGFQSRDGEMGAVQQHLKDMRAIVAKKTGVELG